MKSVRIKVKCLDKDLLPSYQSVGSSGLDLRSAVELTVYPGKISLVPTGLYLEIPLGYEAQIRPRSGLALKHGITVLNTPGTIDADYRGEIKVILINLSDNPFVVRKGDRIAQMVISEVIRAELELTDKVTETDRGEGGFGSTGID
ncbi:deoxyuridine 5'-triphosphate nucleotidohydrolase [Deferribacter desulfuricans SSM1]|uniref:Deoxyuridine 5'-triphosphate nucleotidohydrolase n=1 Tax=Deferribacter desulfuricans (strain DSM 14783 / JCM 11476 / NBRC 101012 / SSM1) TaxID=639282 RepID=D3PEF6_DEFDS|nr:dUTP diphosphatase [Deferribacter desulfuricans]BAI80979.1 deoxyuridine 5'-triphosphate nucleotidohydrolase [Deferribacter desulfuricans SSM1]